MLVSEASVRGPWNETEIMAATNQNAQLSQKIKDMQLASENFTKLENEDCSLEFSRPFVSDWAALILVLNTTDQGGVYRVAQSASEKGFNTNPFFCGESKGIADCDKAGNLNGMNSWHWHELACDQKKHSSNPYYCGVQAENDYTVLQYCLAQPAVQSCRVEVSLILLFIVIFCNAVKVMCLFLVLWLPSFQPLITMGDAIATFLACPDSTTSLKGALIHHKSESDTPTAPYWRPTRIRWFRSVDGSRWIKGVCFIAGLWLLIYCFLVASIIGRKKNGYSSNLHTAWSIGYGAIDASYLIQATIDAPILVNVLIVNLPQLILSLAYVVYNTLLTSMLRSAEYSSYSLHRKPLRVSQPTGIQRSTYWLQLPFRYAMPLIVAFGALHWLVSESVFLVNIIVANEATGESTSACGWSEAALISVLILLGLLAAVLLGIAFFRRHPPGLVAEDLGSMAISKRCHSPYGTENTTRLRVKFGFVEREELDGKGRLGFSTGTVESLKQEDVYVYDEPMESVNAGWFLYSTRGFRMPKNMGIIRDQLRSNP